MSDEEIDRELWDLIRAGEPTAFERLYLRHGNTIYNFCGRRVADWRIAEDLTSAVFLEAWRRRDVDLGDTPPLAWLYGIAINTTRNARRSAGRGRRLLRRLYPTDTEPDFADDVALQLDDEKLMARILAVLDRLPQAERDILALCVWEGLTYEAAAQALGIPVGTVRSRLARARARLRELTDEARHRAVDTGERDGGHRS